MKRRVLFIFILIFWMIALSTFLSIRVEEWMMPYISTTKTEPQDVHKEIPADALFYDDAGIHIYHVRNGQGWESGLRVYEVERADYFVIDGKVRFSQADGEFVRYASRTLRVGEEVRQPENVFLTEDDNWVAVFPEGIPKYELKTTKMSVETKTDTSMIVCAPNAGVPFMEDRARSMVIVEKEDSDWYEPHTSRFYSLGELKTFMNDLLLLGVLTAMMIFTVILWAWSFWLSREYIKNRTLLIINSAVSAGLLALSPLLLHFIDLPTSMLPQYHITDLSHYRQFFGELFRELNRLTDAGSEIAAAAVKHTKQSGMFFVILVVCGVLFGVTAIILEAILSKHRKIGGQKMKHRMYRKISLILAVLLLITMFTGCAEKETGPLKICVDLGSFSAVYEPGRGNGMADGNQQHAMQMFEANLKGYLQMNSLDPIELEIEYIPEHTPEGNPERDTMIARLRTEIMSGKGPDIFLLGCNDRDMEPLFKVPEKNMVNGAFLPLNDYIENAQFMEFDKLVPGVMSAGQYDDEQ